MAVGPPSTALANLNTPILTSSLGALSAACLPRLSKLCQSGKLPFRVLNVAVFCLNVWATRRPGRLDGRHKNKNNNNSNKSPNLKYLLEERDKSLFMPQNWAFSIWAPIMFGELLSVTLSLLVKKQSNLYNLLQQSAAGFIVAQLFQSLWAATFRPKYMKSKDWSSWISAGMLVGIATSLNAAHCNYVSQVSQISRLSNTIFFWPVSLHFAWSTAASLINFNGNLNMVCDNKQVVAGVACASVCVATVLGVSISLSRRAPTFGAVIAWALAACATSMQERIEERDDRTAKRSWWRTVEIKSRQGYYGARCMQVVSTVGAVLSGSAALFVLFRPSNESSP